MRLFRRPSASATQVSPLADEDPLVRQYRYLLRTAPVDALEHAHLEALTAVGSSDREVVLRTVQDQLVSGLRLQPDDVPALARLVVLGERRSPGSVLRHCDAEVLRRLGHAALTSEAAFGLLNGYAAWDGRDPEPAPEEEWEARRHRNWREVPDPEGLRKTMGHIPPGSGGFGGGGDGGG